MEVICAGFPKTGTKSLSAGLRELGYNVCDAMETTESGLSRFWWEYMQGHAGISSVIEAYAENGFTVNQDLPGNFYWEQLFEKSPNVKVILSVRDDEHTWFKSWVKFNREFSLQNGVFGLLHLESGIFGLKWRYNIKCGMFSNFEPRTGPLIPINNKKFR